jgi:uncharacterized membrane protein
LNGVFTFFDYPGAQSTLAYAINDDGIIVGEAWTNSGGSSFGFSYDGNTFTKIQFPGQPATAALGIDNAGDIVGWAGNDSMIKGFELKNGTFTVISPPGIFKITQANGINNFGEIVGIRGTGTNTRGFDFKNGQYTTITIPKQYETNAVGINDGGTIVGWYLGSLPDPYRGFVLVNGKFTSFTYPGAPKTYFYGINSLGEIVGTYVDSQGMAHGIVTSPITTAKGR